eukprot:4479321-Amphidinium_carterae.1
MQWSCHLQKVVSYLRAGTRSGATTQEHRPGCSRVAFGRAGLRIPQRSTRRGPACDFLGGVRLSNA